MGDVTPTNGSISGFTKDDATHYHATFTATDGVSAPGSVSVAAGSYTDAAGNLGGTGSDSVTIDQTNPSVTITPTDDSSSTRSETITFSEAVTGFTTSDISVSTGTISSLTTSDNITWTLNITGAPSGNTDITVTIANNSYTDLAGNLGSGASITNAPAGITGSPLNLALSDLSGSGATVTSTISGMPADWSLNQGTYNGDGSWTVVTGDPTSLYVTTASGFAGAMVLNVFMSWTNADGSTSTAFLRDNVEAYPASPIFAISGDDTLTGSAGDDEFVFAQPIANDRIYNFDAVNDTVDLIGFGLGGYGDLVITTNGNGNAVVTLGTGMTITLVGVDAGALSASNFVFDEEPVSHNPGMMTIGNGAILPIGGTIENSGTIALNSTDSESDLEILVRGATLTGGGQIMLSDNSQNVVFGGDASAVLDNVDNTISGAGQLGAGSLTLKNEGVIAATGSNALVLNTGANVITNTGTLAASGAGGLVVESALQGGGKAEISGSSSIEFAAASDAAVSFDIGATGTLKLDNSGSFTGTVAGFALGDAIDLRDIVAGSNETLGYAVNATGSGGTLTVSDGTHTASLALLGQYAAADFVSASDGQGGTLVTHFDPNHPVIAATS